MSDRKKEVKNFNPNLVLIVMVVLCTIASYFVAAGAYDRETINGVTRVVATSYHEVARTPVSIFKMFQSIPQGLTGAAMMMFAVMIIGGVVEIYNATGVMGAAINSVLKLSKKVGSQLIIAIVMLVFMFIGGILGWSEQIIPFVPIVVSLAISLGYDSLVGMAISGFACLISFAVGPFNVFTVGTSHAIAELPMFSGWQFRLAVLAVVAASSLAWVLRYAAKIKNDPSKSLMNDIDTSSLVIPIEDSNALDGVKTFSLLVMGVCFGFTVWGLLTKGWGFGEMSAIFLIGGVIVGGVNRMTASEICDTIVKGALGAFGGALIIGLARSVQWVMTQGGLVDPLVHGLTSMMSTASSYVTSVIMFIVNFFINALIPSGSGQAMAVMPIMIPMADMLHITRQTAVLAFQFGDGISNTLWFTNGTLLIYCGLAKVPLKKWYRFIIPLQIFFFLVQLGFLYLADKIGYGPM
ncbi:MAG: hypothetical protein SOY64_05470 [Pyramidobacter sp.]|uniref:YfcC family protein n=1 Tax=Pyramidobacter sp. TaxID=1943581 RepID=UPI002A83FEA0|nr:Na+/H+ antiporter NhaC family protein [Pyramidobacter sp.]MDY4032507.1 hypothetical protein [Pyramidobacter sp.]